MIEFISVKMSGDEDILSKPLPPEQDLSPEVADYLAQLRRLAEAQRLELEAIRQKSQRLDQKLKNVHAYNEELRDQVRAQLSLVSLTFRA